MLTPEERAAYDKFRLEHPEYPGRTSWYKFIGTPEGRAMESRHTREGMKKIPPGTLGGAIRKGLAEMSAEAREQWLRGSAIGGKLGAIALVASGWNQTEQGRVHHISNGRIAGPKAIATRRARGTYDEEIHRAGKNGGPKAIATRKAGGTYYQEMSQAGRKGGRLGGPRSWEIVCERAAVFHRKPVAGVNSLACEFFDRLSKHLNVEIQHGTNGGEHIFRGADRWWRVDGYIPAYNIVLEWDEAYHAKGPVHEEDVLRQREIERQRNCRFIRIRQGEEDLERVADEVLSDGKRPSFA
jgi:hypothetical protein